LICFSRSIALVHILKPLEKDQPVKLVLGSKS
jgi:hypothetical protein